MIEIDEILQNEIQNFKDGKIRQGSLLKMVKNEISELIKRELPLASQIASLEKTMSIKLNYENYKSWIKNNKKKIFQNEKENGNTQKSSNDIPQKESKKDSEESLPKKPESYNAFSNLM